MYNFPIKIIIFGHPIYLHFIMETLGMFLGARYYWYLRKKEKEKKLLLTSSLVILIGASFGAYFGSHLLGSLENIPTWENSSNKLLYFLSNKTLVGGLIGGLIGVELSKKIIGEKRSTGDLFVFPLLLAMIIGRIGCFSTGIYEQTFGLPTSLPWGLNLGDNLLRHPVTLYEILFLIILWIVLKIIQKKYTLKSGALFIIFMISYLTFRFLLDFIKPGWRFFFSIGSIQIACLLGLFYYRKYILNPKKLNLSIN